MGHAEVGVIIRSRKNGKALKTKGLVDTGATLTVLPRRVAEQISVKSYESAKALTAGGPVDIRVGEVILEIGGKKAAIRVAISDIIDRVLIGVAALEILGLSVDPQTCTLKESHYLLY